MIEEKEGTTTIAAFEYDGKRRRTEKTAAGITHTYIYDAEDIVEERITGSSTDTIRYFHGAGFDEPLARTNSSSVVTHYLADHLGSIVQETAAAGVASLEREYDPWGNPLQGGSVSGYGFQSREWDAETRLLYARARYYDPSSGAWAGDDPIGLAGGVNLSRFVSNNPVRFIDPFGLCETDGQSPSPRRKTSERLLNFLKEYETLEPQRYRDQGGKWTIGYGHRVYPGDTVTAVSDIGATDILSRDVKWAEDAVNNPNVSTGLTNRRTSEWPKDHCPSRAPDRPIACALSDHAAARCLDRGGSSGRRGVPAAKASGDGANPKQGVSAPLFRR